MHRQRRILATTTIGLICIFLILVSGPIKATDEKTYGSQPEQSLIPRDEYEFKFLGVKLHEPNQARIGLFLLIWKRPKAIELNGFGFDEKKRFRSNEFFSIRNKDGWHVIAGNWCGPGVTSYKFEPGQVVTISVNMEWLDFDHKDQHLLEGADKAILRLSTARGLLFSEEIPLPLPK